jgi:hypothetical protein
MHIMAAARLCRVRVAVPSFDLIGELSALSDPA